jgi:hypothetical protein
MKRGVNSIEKTSALQFFLWTHKRLRWERLILGLEMLYGNRPWKMKKKKKKKNTVLLCIIGYQDGSCAKCLWNDK